MTSRSGRRWRRVAELLGVGDRGDGAQVGAPGGGRRRRPAGVTTEESAEIKRLKRENAELRRANAILKAASAFFAAELDRPSR